MFSHNVFVWECHVRPPKLTAYTRQPPDCRAAVVHFKGIRIVEFNCYHSKCLNRVINSTLDLLWLIAEKNLQNMMSYIHILWLFPEGLLGAPNLTCLLRCCTVVGIIECVEYILLNQCRIHITARRRNIKSDVWVQLERGLLFMFLYYHFLK